MSYLLDTNILVRLANSADALYPAALRAVTALHHLGETIHITPQNLVEFRGVATRPIPANGLGLAPAAVETKAEGFEQKFALLADTPDIFPTWKSLVNAASVIGKQVHDARLVAVCHVHSVSHLLTFNTAHFARFASVGKGIVAVDPASV